MIKRQASFGVLSLLWIVTSKHCTWWVCFGLRIDNHTGLTTEYGQTYSSGMLGLTFFRVLPIYPKHHNLFAGRSCVHALLWLKMRSVVRWIQHSEQRRIANIRWISFRHGSCCLTFALIYCYYYFLNIFALRRSSKRYRKKVQIAYMVETDTYHVMQWMRRKTLMILIYLTSVIVGELGQHFAEHLEGRKH